MTVVSRLYGELRTGEPISAHLITGPSAGGPTLEILDLGAVVRTLTVPDRAGRPVNVVLGYGDLDHYVTGDAYFGAVVGRYANRIAEGRFELDGQTYVVPANEGSTALHGGPDGFHARRWSTIAVGETSLTLGLVSADGDQGFPGRLDATVTYTVERDTVRVEYVATTDRPTIVNLTNHTYFNLSGEEAGTTDDHVLTGEADSFTPVDSASIPTGELQPVAGTPFDFQRSVVIGPRVRVPHPQLMLTRGVDHNFVIRGAGERRHATLTSPVSGIRLEVFSDEPGIQIYTGNFLDGSIVGTTGRTYRQGAGIALETQHYPDSPNQPSFPSTELRPGEEYRSTTSWRFSVVEQAV